MCDDQTVRDTTTYLAETRSSATITRRRFAATTATGALLASLPAGASVPDSLIANDVTITTPDGEADAYFVHPAQGRHPAVLIWPDIKGLRPAFRVMASRLAADGYAVLVVNPYYRDASAPVVAPGETFQMPEVRERLMPLARSLSAATTQRDAKAFIDYLDHQDAVDTTARIGTTGYCMGGPMVLQTAATSARIGAAASFHGSRLVTDGDDSPHRLIPQMSADFLIAIAENDHEREPAAKDRLRTAFADAGLTAEIEVYENALHGWCPPDSHVYHEPQAERAWSRLLVLFNRALSQPVGKAADVS